jgi:3-hydroxyisobutyrate dehydrogenase-like beta-hydroxyacid dehydrogenase
MPPPPHLKNVGLLGLGIIGSRSAENLRKAGHDVFVWSRTARPVPNFLASPREVAQAASVVQIFVRDGEALLEAVGDMAPALEHHHVIVNNATVSKDATLEAAAICEKASAGYLDAPFTGSKNAAAAGKLVYYVGGEEFLLDRVRAVLEATSTSILQVGDIGDASVLKIATNLVSAVTAEVLAEAAAIVKADGGSTESLLKALELNANYSQLVGMKLPAMIKGDFEPHFSLRNMLKDVEFGRAMASKLEVKVPALDATADVMKSGVQAGKGDLDFSVIGETVTSSEETP